LVGGAALVACESPFRDRVDSSSYSLIAQRQRAALGTTADSRIGPGEIPLRVSSHIYDTVPPTVNELPPASATPVAPDTTQPATAPASAPAATPSTATAPATSPSIDALLQNLPGIQLDKMPDLPEFPKPVVAGKTRRTLNLDDAFNLALAHNRDYQSRKEDLYLATLNVALQRHVFELQPFATTALGLNGKGEASDYSAAYNASQTIGVKQNLPTGGQIIAQTLVSTVQDIRQSVASASGNVSLSANIPLLRGAGTVAQESLISAERSMIYQVRTFERYRRGFLVTVASQYFNLVNQRAQIVNRFSNVRSYIFITERSKALFEAELTSRRTTLLDVMRAAQSEYQARSSLINSIESYELALDRFKILLGIPVEDPIDVTPQYLTIAPPNISEADAVAIASRLRLDLQNTRDQVDDARRVVKNAANGLLPDLSLNASVGMGSDPNAKSVLPEFEQLNYSAGLTYNWPLDRVAEGNTYRSALVSLDRAKRSVDSAQDQVSSDVRAAVRAVRQQQVVLAIQKNNIDLAQKRKEFSDIQFRDGKIDNRDYLDAETALLDAQNSFAQALSDLEVAVLNYLQNTDQLRVDFSGHLQLPDSPKPAANTTSAAAATDVATTATRP
jgi:outer membrane protein TolC